MTVAALPYCSMLLFCTVLVLVCDSVYATFQVLCVPSHSAMIQNIFPLLVAVSPPFQKMNIFCSWSNEASCNLFFFFFSFFIWDYRDRNAGRYPYLSVELMSMIVTCCTGAYVINVSTIGLHAGHANGWQLLNHMKKFPSRGHEKYEMAFPVVLTDVVVVTDSDNYNNSSDSGDNNTVFICKAKIVGIVCWT